LLCRGPTWDYYFLIEQKQVKMEKKTEQEMENKFARNGLAAVLKSKNLEPCIPFGHALAKPRGQAESLGQVAGWVRRQTGREGE
jgi:hypothetical protein